MPELPEVETTRRGILPYLKNKSIETVAVRNRQLRWPVPARLKNHLSGQKILDITRRGKYLVFGFDHGHMLIHLGMSGSLRIVKSNSEIRKHDHIDWLINNGRVLRYHDPRKFGSVLWTSGEPGQHKLLKTLGPEPLSDTFDAGYLYEKSRKRQLAVKNFIMNSTVVTGVGNIYANEALFLAGIHPLRQAGKISFERYEALVTAIKNVLHAAIEQGGTTLRDFVNGDGNPGYFRQQLRVYQRAGQPCCVCKKPVRLLSIGQRASYYCTECQR